MTTEAQLTAYLETLTETGAISEAERANLTERLTVGEIDTVREACRDRAPAVYHEDPGTEPGEIRYRTETRVNGTRTRVGLRKERYGLIDVRGDAPDLEIQEYGWYHVRTQWHDSDELPEIRAALEQAEADAALAELTGRGGEGDE